MCTCIIVAASRLPANFTGDAHTAGQQTPSPQVMHTLPGQHLCYRHLQVSTLLLVTMGLSQPDMEARAAASSITVLPAHLQRSQEQITPHVHGSVPQPAEMGCCAAICTHAHL